MKLACKLFPFNSQLVNAKSARVTAQKMKFSIKDFFSKCDQTRRNLWIWSNLLKKSLMENFIFCAVSTDPCEELVKLRSGPDI